MAESLEYKEAMGSFESHVEVLRKRVEQAQAIYNEAVDKAIPAQIEGARIRLEEQQQILTDFEKSQRN